jgi:hypothetical protein
VGGGEGLDGGDGDRGAVGRVQQVAGFERPGGDPRAAGRVPEGMVLCGVQDRLVTLGIGEGEVGEVGVLVDVQCGDGLDGSVAGLRIGDVNMIAELDLIDRFARPCTVPNLASGS